MYGLVNKAMQDLVVSRHGQATWEAIKRRAGIDMESFVSMSPYPIEQVILAVGNNGLDSMPHGGTLTIRASSPCAGALRVQVIDSGCGMSEDVRSRVFEPVFTAKEVGKGTRLGLSLTHEVVRQHRGSIAVESWPEEGTTVTVRLPCRPRAKIIEAVE